MNMKTKVLNTIKAFLLPVALYLVVLLLIPSRVGSLDSVTSMLTLAVVPTITAYGVHFGFASGIMDFSVGSRIALTSMAGCIGGYFFGPVGMFLGAILASLLLATIVGGLFAVLKIPSFVISMGCLMAFEVAGEMLAKRLGFILPNLSTGQYLKAPETMLFLGKPPFNFLVLILVAIVFELLNTRTKAANQARVVGSDELIARNVGIKPMKVKFGTYILGSIFLALASVESVCYSSAVGYSQNMASMSAVFKPMMSVIIGMSLGGLVRSSIGILIGNLCLSVMFTGIIALGWPDSLQNIFLGAFLVIILALPTVQGYLATFKRRSAARKAHVGAPAAQP